MARYYCALLASVVTVYLFAQNPYNPLTERTVMILSVTNLDLFLPAALSFLPKAYALGVAVAIIAWNWAWWLIGFDGLAWYGPAEVVSTLWALNAARFVRSR
ncbi:MAG: hypothetical protein C7B46_10565 [Sulfobacillus benefaciens]|uniref:Uncharacterized protein n=1 Tax=Sulfobacillus benefaciens TaxID=453960 RepID=A0A2T2XFQ4_9FIRM|nr:MAG: hypothetical protein C7B46_10565 [Sulfobacillus benefaciens]